MALVGNTFYQVSSMDPGTGFPMYYWNQTNTGLIYIRDPSDSGWVFVGDSAEPNLGQLSLQGGAMNGAITGAHGLSPADANNFTTSLQIQGLDVATKFYVDQQDALLSAAIATGIVSALASIPSLNLGTRVASDRGTWTQNPAGTSVQTINLPQYSDGIQAAASECIWGAALTGVGLSIIDGHTTQSSVVETAPRVFTLTAVDSGAAVGMDVTAAWWIIAFRKTT